MIQWLSNYGGALLVIGALMTAWSWDQKTLVSRLHKKGIHTRGKVVELRDNPNPSSNAPGKAPTVEYTTQSGNTIRHISTTYQSPSPYSVGQEVDIWYRNYKSRRDAVLADDRPSPFFDRLFRLGLILALIGGLLTGTRLNGLF